MVSHQDGVLSYVFTGSLSSVPTRSNETISFADFSSVGQAYVVLTSKMADYLANANFRCTRRAFFGQINFLNRVPLSQDTILKVKSSKNMDDLLDSLAAEEERHVHVSA